MRNELINPKKPWVWIAGAIILATVGHVALQILTFEFLDWSLWEGVWLLTLLGLSIAVSIFSIPRIPRPRIRRGAVERKPEVLPLHDITSAPALIVYVSKNPTGPYRIAIDQFSSASGSSLKHVFLVHSKQSKGVTDTLYQDINDDETKNYTAHKDGLLADFSDLQDMYKVSLAAVNHALEQVTNPDDVVIDVTGGTAIASAGAVLAGLRNTGVSLTYIPPGEDGGLGTTIKRVDVTLVPENGEDETTPGDEAA